jgi:hypothetical protein
MYRIRIGSGFKWVSRSGFKQEKLVSKKRKRQILCLKSSLFGWRFLLELKCLLQMFKQTHIKAFDQNFFFIIKKTWSWFEEFSVGLEVSPGA